MLSVAAVFLLLSAIIINKAPDATFMTITGKKIALHDLRGKPVLITFWATDCPTCIEEIPDLIALYEHYHKVGLEIIAVAMYYDIPSHVVALTEAKKIPYNVVLDLKSEHARAFGQVHLIPSTFLISPEGGFAMKKTGVFNSLDIKTRIDKLLKG